MLVSQITTWELVLFPCIYVNHPRSGSHSISKKSRSSGSRGGIDSSNCRNCEPPIGCITTSDSLIISRANKIIAHDVNKPSRRSMKWINNEFAREVRKIVSWDSLATNFASTSWINASSCENEWLIIPRAMNHYREDAGFKKNVCTTNYQCLAAITFDKSAAILHEICYLER